MSRVPLTQQSGTSTGQARGLTAVTQSPTPSAAVPWGTSRSRHAAGPQVTPSQVTGTMPQMGIRMILVHKTCLL